EVAHDVAGHPPVAGRGVLPRVVGHRLHAGGELACDPVVVRGELAHGPSDDAATPNSSRPGHPGVTAIPPSRGMTAPVMKAAAGDARKIASPAASSGVPARARGTCESSSLRPSGVPSVLRVIRESNGPGAMTFTVMWSAASRR